MRSVEILHRAHRNNTRRIDVVVSKVVMTLDVIEVNDVGNSVELIQIAKVSKQIRVIHNPADIAFEMPVINRVKSDQRYKKSPIRFERKIAE